MIGNDDHILYFHTTIWSDFFSKLLLHYQKKGCQVAIVCKVLDADIYKRNFVAGAVHYVLPDLEARQPWEDDREAEKRLLILVHQCETSCLRAISRTILSAERSFGRAYSARSYYWPRNSLHGVCRRDNLLPHRMALRAFASTFEIFDEFRPDLVLLRGFVGPLPSSAWMLAYHRNIPMYAAQFSKAVSKHAFWTDDYLMYNTSAKRRYKEMVASSVQPSSWAMEQIEVFRNTPRTVDYIAQNWARRSDWFKAHRNFLGLAKAKARYYFAGGKGARPKPVAVKIVEYYRNALMKTAHKRYFSTFDEDALAGMKYVYYPLHKEPELMLNYKAPLWHDELHTIKYISSMIPSGYRLLVREHRFNWGRRFGRYLRDMKSLPGVMLVHPFEPQFKYIKNADLVLTDNGSSGWEGILLRRPVVTLERSFYDVLPQANHVKAPSLLDQDMLRVLAEFPGMDDHEYDRHIGLLLDAEREHSLSIDKMQSEVALSASVIEQLLKKRNNTEGA